MRERGEMEGKKGGRGIRNGNGRRESGEGRRERERENREEIYIKKTGERR